MSTIPHARHFLVSQADLLTFTLSRKAACPSLPTRPSMAPSRLQRLQYMHIPTQVQCRGRASNHSPPAGAVPLHRAVPAGAAATRTTESWHPGTPTGQGRVTFAAAAEQTVSACRL